MPRLTTDDGVHLFVEETGSGEPILFIHEFAGDHRSWELQVRFFGQLYRCITYNARGYPPSEVPTAAEAYSQERAVADAVEQEPPSLAGILDAPGGAFERGIGSYHARGSAGETVAV